MFCRVFFFFKQKTAYEMRISDWSSTCALPIFKLNATGGEPTLRKDLETLVAEADRMGYYTNLITSGIGLTEARLSAMTDADRKSVVSGKSVSVRVDLGGRRSSKKKTLTTTRISRRIEIRIIRQQNKNHK